MKLGVLKRLSVLLLAAAVAACTIPPGPPTPERIEETTPQAFLNFVRGKTIQYVTGSMNVYPYAPFYKFMYFTKNTNKTVAATRDEPAVYEYDISDDKICFTSPNPENRIFDGCRKFSKVKRSSDQYYIFTGGGQYITYLFIGFDKMNLTADIVLSGRAAEKLARKIEADAGPK